MYACVRAYVQIPMFVCLLAPSYVFGFRRMFVSKYVRMYARAYVCMYVCMHAGMYEIEFTNIHTWRAKKRSENSAGTRAPNFCDVASHLVP